MNETNTTTNASAAMTAQHTPGPWATDISEAAETIKQEGCYDSRAFRRALGEIADGHKNPKTIAMRALDAEQSDARINGAVIYRNDASSAQGDQICSFPHDTEDGLVLDAETIANARLIASAPELLAFIENARAHAMDGNSEEAVAELIGDYCLALISKATGI